MTPWRRLVGDRPIVTRLVMAVAITMTAVLLVAGGFVFWRVGFALNRQLDQDLDAYQQVVQRAISTGSTPPTDTPGQSYQIYDLRGRIIAGDATRRLADQQTVEQAAAGTKFRVDVGSLLPPTDHPFKVGVAQVVLPRGTVVVAAAISKNKHDEALRELLLQLATYLTDMSVHPLWVHRSVDVHLALNELPAREARHRGARDVRIVRPAVPAAFVAPEGAGTSRQDARQAFGLPLDERLVLVAGGSCGIGDLERTAADIVTTALAIPVVLCARNQRLLRRIHASGSAIGLGWTDDMPSLLNAVDAVVQNSGGFTSLEALAAGVPILTYRCIAGHGETNADALDQAGLVPWIREHRDLATRLGVALSTPRTNRPSTSWLRRVDVADAIASLIPIMST